MGCRRADGPALRATWTAGAERSTVRLHARLRRLEQEIGVACSCPACRHRQGQAVLIERYAPADGTGGSEPPEPAPCAVCGPGPEVIIEVNLTEIDAPRVPSN